MLISSKSAVWKYKISSAAWKHSTILLAVCHEVFHSLPFHVLPVQHFISLLRLISPPACALFTRRTVLQPENKTQTQDFH